ILTNRLSKVEANLKKPKPAKEREADQAEQAILQRLIAALEAGQMPRSLGLKPDEEKAVRSFQLLTLKPEIVFVNQGEGGQAGPGRAGGAGEAGAGVGGAAAGGPGGVRGRPGAGRLAARRHPALDLRGDGADRVPDGGRGRVPGLADPQRGRRGRRGGAGPHR